MVGDSGGGGGGGGGRGRLVGRRRGRLAVRKDAWELEIITAVRSGSVLPVLTAMHRQTDVPTGECACAVRGGARTHVKAAAAQVVTLLLQLQRKVAWKGSL